RVHQPHALQPERPALRTRPRVLLLRAPVLAAPLRLGHPAGGVYPGAVRTPILVAALYVLQRSLVLTARGPRLAAGARTHLLGLAALLLVLRGIGFWLDRFDLLFSPRGLVFGASYTDVHASLPVLQWLGVLALLCAAACVFQMFRPGWRFLVAGLVVLVVLWVAGLGIAPALLQSYRVKPNELAFERPYIENHIRMTRQC